MRFFATSARGTERALAEELDEVGIRRTRLDRAGVGFQGKWEHAYRVCLESRIAMRVLFACGQFECRDERALYEGVRAFEWREHIHPKLTLAVSAVCRDSALSHTMFVAQRTKDAIVDQIRDSEGERPSVDRADPDVSVFVRIVGDRASIWLDLAGESLHRRGFRAPGEAAPLKETLAAAILRISRWDRERPLIDPMCGSGTIAIEADLWARRIAPGLRRRRFGFERWASFEERLRARLELLRERARSAALAEGPRILASDADANAVDRARANAKRAGAHVELRQASIATLRGSDPPGHVVTNPPYGERLHADTRLYAEIEASIARLSPGHRVTLLLAARNLLALPRSAERRRVYNGALECELVSFDVR